LVARELKICPYVRVAWIEPLGLAISGNRSAKLTGFETGVAEIEIKRRGGVARMNYFFISLRPLGKFVLIIAFVRGLE